VLIVFLLARIESRLTDIKNAAENLDWRATRLDPLLKHEPEVVERYDEDLARRTRSSRQRRGD
jgi:hypothetical protein